MKRIGLFGGSFNPIHEGHIAIAKEVRKRFQLQEIWFLPTASTPLKEELEVSFRNRCQMIRLAIRPYRYMKLSQVEETLPLPSYTFNTVSKLRKIYPDIEFFWIIGYDQYKQLNQWYKIDELKRMIQFIVVNRGNEKLKTEFLQLSNFDHSASSTAIRNGDFKFLYPSVRNYIIANVLYFLKFLPQYYSNERWLHAKSVAHWCQEIAKGNNINENDALLTGYMHDIAKKMSQKEMQTIMETYFKEQMHYDVKVWHQFVGYYLAKYQFFIKNRRILDAIAHHTTGTSFSKFSKMLYCADKIDDTRSYNTSYFRKLVVQDLNSAFILIYQEAEKYRNEKE